MTRNQQPVTDDEIAALREAMRDQHAEIRAYLAERGVDVSGWGEDTVDTRVNGKD